MKIKLILALIPVFLSVYTGIKYNQWYGLMDQITSHNKNIQVNPVTAVFVGGTSGIGEHTAYKIAQYTDVDKIVISGRNRAAGESIVDKLNVLSNVQSNEFIECDAVLMRNVLEYTDEIKQKFNKLNYLVVSMSPTGGSFFTRSENEEGIEKNLALAFYARFLIIKELVPLLEKAAEAGEEARVISVLHSGRYGALDYNDLELKNYGFIRMVLAGSTYTSLAMEAFADRHPTVSFIHSYPGFVYTPLFNLFPWFLRYPFSLLGQIAAISSEDCGEIMTYLLTSDKYKNGVHLVDERGVEGPLTPVNTKENSEIIYNHAVDITNRGRLSK